MKERVFELTTGTHTIRAHARTEGELYDALRAHKWRDAHTLAWALWQGMGVEGHPAGTVQEVTPK